MGLLDFIARGNPKVTHNNISFQDYLENTKEINQIFIELTGKYNSRQKIHSNINFTKCNIEGAFLKHPICELPKATLINNFYNLEENKISLHLEIEPDLFEDINKKYQLKLSNEYRKFNIGRIYYGKNIFANAYTSIIINNSYSDYIKYFTSKLKENDTEVYIKIAFQKIKNLDFLLIFDLSIWSRNDEYGELGNLMKNHSFNFKTGSDWPDVTQLVSQ
jgi:hypothetical protein